MVFIKKGDCLRTSERGFNLPQLFREDTGIRLPSESTFFTKFSVAEANVAIAISPKRSRRQMRRWLRMVSQAEDKQKGQRQKVINASPSKPSQ